MSFNFFRTSSSSFWDLEGLLGTGLGLGFGEGESIFLSETRAKGLCLGGGNPCLKLWLGEDLEGFPFPNLDFTLNQKVLNLFLKTIPKTTNKIKIDKTHIHNVLKPESSLSGIQQIPPEPVHESEETSASLFSQVKLHLPPSNSQTVKS